MPCVRLQVEDEDEPDYAGDVVEILNSALPPDGPTSPRKAAQLLDSICSRKYADGFLWWFWDLIHDLDLPPKTFNLGETRGLGSDSQTELWTTLTMFANTFREKLDDDDSRAPGEEQRKARYVNLQVYGARVTGLCRLPFEVYAIWSLVDTLEGTITTI
ncbi:hypothetical protein HRG_000280 [Hirsutella rhossiliensis]|uniref:Uncharacterized protein n=1 Tax=Hirsutella rhossiliensis TaxID=111463 RepID=A0A9P8SLM4_9HYPO|nr:uncharacterized protein HRG_00280 [Hirsutella rhossiliensis]KAH0967638.1 hypothetical protein HRG_00280 [Hirsutella rhossiliensis]